MVMIHKGDHSPLFFLHDIQSTTNKWDAGHFGLRDGFC